MELAGTGARGARLLWSVIVAIALGACAGPRVHRYVDPFDGPTRGFDMPIDYSRNTGMSAHETSAGVAFRLTVAITGKLADVVPAGTPVEFRVGDQTRVLTTSSDATPMAHIDLADVVTQWQLPFALTRAQVAWFAEAPLRAIRVSIGSRQRTFKLLDWVQEQFQTNMRTLSAPAS